MSNLWYIWLILGALFILAEMFTTGFVLLWFGVGALVAGIFALTGLVGLPFQIIIFLAVSIILAVASRTIFEDIFKLGSPGSGLKSGIDSLPGRIGVVITSSSGPRREAEVRVFGSIWRAFPAEGEDALSEGQQVQIERVDGVSVYVRHVDQLPSWRAANQLTE
ncbi:MAG TPA: NfeD family protein [Blastocatellia bacterium]|nr:NfeD family protein [Blastocatellia bacterium]